MAVKPIPEGHHSITPYLVVESVPTLIDFVKQAFGAEEVHRSTRPDGTVVHAQVRIGDSMVMMGEANEQYKPRPGTMYLYVNDTDATYERALRSGATSLMGPQDMFYGDRNAGVEDPVGNQWWIATHKEDVPPEELEKRAQAAMKQRHRGS